MISGIVALLTSGAGGGIVGGLFGLFRQWGERKERVQMAEIELQRDQLEAQERQKDREHESMMLEKGATLQLQQTVAEGEIEADIAAVKARGKAAWAEFRNLNTSTWMDNVRASVRPVFAYYVMIVFSILLFWAFGKFNDTITADVGAELLMDLISTLIFMLTSITAFYYVSRRNARPT